MRTIKKLIYMSGLQHTHYTWHTTQGEDYLILQNYIPHSI